MVCPHQCRLRDGQHGLCYVRRNKGGKLWLLSYGRVSGCAVDPVEKKPLYHFLPGTPTLSLGGIGCNLSCRFCQNWAISKPNDDQALTESIAPTELARVARVMQCPSVSFTYNEPVVALEFVADAARACREAGLRTIAVTNGYIVGDARAEFFAQMDAANVDLKSFKDEFYRKLCGARLAPVLETLQFIRHQTKVWLEITNLLIPGENDSPAEIEALSRWIVHELGGDVPVHFSAFFPAFRLTDHPVTPSSTLVRARDIAGHNGIRFVYLGNTNHTEGQTTRCASCGTALIERDRMKMLRNHLTKDGSCPRCGTICPGVFH